MVEAIVTIANDSFLLKAVKNPFVRKDRSIVAAQWHRRPGKFWGIGDVEKSYHPQKALQTEMRARADGLGLSNYGIVFRDIGSLVGEQVREGQDAKVLEAGKEYYTNGNPAEQRIHRLTEYKVTEALLGRLDGLKLDTHVGWLADALLVLARQRARRTDV